MVTGEHKRAALYEKLQLLRSLTNSHAINKTSIIVDASKYIEELKQKVDRLNRDIAFAAEPTDHNTSPMVNVENVEKGFLITVLSMRSSAGLLVSILEAFEELGLNVLQARVSCMEPFRLEAIAENEEQAGSMDAQVVKQGVLQAINNCSGAIERN